MRAGMARLRLLAVVPYRGYFTSVSRDPRIAMMLAPTLEVGSEPAIVIDIPEASNWQALVNGIVAQSRNVHGTQDSKRGRGLL